MTQTWAFYHHARPSFGFGWAAQARQSPVLGGRVCACSVVCECLDTLVTSYTTRRPYPISLIRWPAAIYCKRGCLFSFWAWPQSLIRYIYMYFNCDFSTFKPSSMVIIMLPLSLHLDKCFHHIHLKKIDQCKLYNLLL